MRTDIKTTELRDTIEGGKALDVIYSDGTKRKLDLKRLKGHRRMLRGQRKNINAEIAVVDEQIAMVEEAISKS
jgi:hypothetical protein